MALSRVSYYVLLCAFVACISYSLVLDSNVAEAVDLETVGLRVVAQYSIASILMLLIWKYYPIDNDDCSPAVSLLIVSIFARLILIDVGPYTSNDVMRYLFDGRIALAGYDPYQISHDAVELTTLRAQWMPPDEHAKYVTLYPPLALGLFSFAASFGPKASVWVWEAITTLASIGVLLLGYKVLQRQKKLRHFPLIALSPLLILEAGEGLHLDVVTALAVLAAVYFWQSRRLVLVGVCLAAGGLLKMLPLVLLLPLFVVLNNWKDRLSLVASALAVWFAGYLVSFYLGFKPVGSIAIFFEKWRSGSALFLWLEPHFSSLAMLGLVLSLLFLGYISVALYLWYLKHRKFNGGDGDSTLGSGLFSCMQLVMALPLLLSPVIFPWYLVPLIVLLALRPNIFLITWSLTIPLLYEVLGQFVCCGDWSPAEWPIHIIGISLIVSSVLALWPVKRIGLRDAVY